MARGWESKAIENQISEAEASRKRPTSPEFTADERERQQRKTMLELSRTKILADLAAATDARYRALQERSLAFVESELAALKATD